MLQRLYGVLLPFFVSFVLAYMLNPIVGFVQNRCRVRNRVLSVVITLVVIISIVVGSVSVLAPVIGREVRAATAGVEAYVSNFDPDRYFSAETQAKFRSWTSNFNIEEFIKNPEVRDGIKTIIPKLLNYISGGLGKIAELVVIFIGFMYLIFLMIDYPKIHDNWSKYVPEKFRPKAVTLMRDINHNMNAYFRGQALVALIVGILFAVGFSIIGLPMGIAMGLIIGLLNMVPYLQLLGIPPCIILCIVQSAETGRSLWLALLLLAVVFLVVQSIQDFILTPKIMGKVMGLSPAAILLSLSVWGALFGLIGMIVALPLTTLGISYYKHYVLKQDL